MIAMLNRDSFLADLSASNTAIEDILPNNPYSPMADRLLRNPYEKWDLDDLKN